MCAAWTIACRPDEQKRLTVRPAVVTGKPGAERGDARHVVPLRPVRLAAAEDHVLDLGRVERRHLRQRRARMKWAARSSGRVMLNEPRKRLRQRRPAAGDDDGFAQNQFLLTRLSTDTKTRQYEPHFS